jgi:predicted Zn-dependent protease
VFEGEQGRSRDREFPNTALRKRVEKDPGCADFPSLAETERRAGRPEEAQHVAECGLAASPERIAGRVALGLALLDQGKLLAAQEALALIFETLPSGEQSASTPAAAAEPQGTPSHRAQASRKSSSGSSGTGRELPVGEGSAFRTRTMARLLERQGDRGRAEAILDELDTRNPEADSGSRIGDPAHGSPGPNPANPGLEISEDRVEKTLERWLRNVQRGADQ